VPCRLDDTGKGTFANLVSTNMDMSGVLPADWIGGQGDGRQIVFVDIRTTLLKVAEMLKDSTDVHDLLATAIIAMYSASWKERRNPGGTFS